MTTHLNFTFSFDRHDGFPPPAVRIWVDTDNDFRAEPNEEVTLTQAGLSWTGQCEIQSASSANTWYLVGYVGSLGSTWSLEVRSDSPQDHAVAAGTGTVKHLRGAFWGMCSQ